LETRIFFDQIDENRSVNTDPAATKVRDQSQEARSFAICSVVDKNTAAWATKTPARH
jgi:hypothetical protein